MEYKRLYLAYGSNINLEQMAYRCPGARVVEATMLRNQELEFRGVATIVPQAGAEVPVLVWEIGQEDEISLDRYEGFPRMYRKEIFELEIGGKMRECMAYVMNHGEVSPPSKSYYAGILRGYSDNGMDTKYLVDAAIRSLSPIEEELDEDEADEDFDEDYSNDELDDMQFRLY